MSLVENGYRIEEDKKGDLWIITPRGLRFPQGRPTSKNTCEKLPVERHLHNRFLNQYPSVKEWLTGFESEDSKSHYGRCLLEFCVFTDMTPIEFGDHWKTTEKMLEARTLATKFVRAKMKESPFVALHRALALKSFFRIYSSGFQLPLDTKRGGAVEIKEAQKAKHRRKRYDWGPPDQFRETVKAIFSNVKDLRKQTALTMLYRCGFRDNVLNHITVGDVQDVIRLNGEELLCLTITTRLDFKLRNIIMHLPSGVTGYYTYLARDGLKLFRTFMKDFHANSSMDTPLFRHKVGRRVVSTRYVPNLRRYFNRLCDRMELPSENMWLHQLRGLFNELAHKYCETNKAEFLTGHKLAGVQEHYQKRHKTELAIEYLKIKFDGE